MICDNNQEFKFNGFSEECFKLCSYENKQTGVKGEIKQNKRQYISKLNQMQYQKQKNNVQYMNIK